jgi:hypothetical protein
LAHLERYGCRSDVELARAKADRKACIRYRAALVRVEVPIGAADDDADLDDSTSLIRLRPELDDRLDSLNLPEVVVGRKPVAVVVEALPSRASRKPGTSTARRWPI